MLSRIHLIPVRDGQTDGRTDGPICYINIVRQYGDVRLHTGKRASGEQHNLMVMVVYIDV